MKKIVTMLLMLSMLLMLAACAGAPKAAPTASQADETTTASTVSEETTPERRVITDGMDRNVEIPYSVERIVCVGVGALRYTCYVGGADRVVGVEDPLTEGVEQDVSGEAGGEHHAGPHEERVFRLLIRLSEADISKPGESQKQGEQEDEEADCQVEQAEGVA